MGQRQEPRRSSCSGSKSFGAAERIRRSTEISDRRIFLANHHHLGDEVGEEEEEEEEERRGRTQGDTKQRADV